MTSVLMSNGPSAGGDASHRPHSFSPPRSFKNCPLYRVRHRSLRSFAPGSKRKHASSLGKGLTTPLSSVEVGASHSVTPRTIRIDSLEEPVDLHLHDLDRHLPTGFTGAIAAMSPLENIQTFKLAPDYG